MEFSTVPSITQPSAIREFETEAFAIYFVGAEFLTFVNIGRDATPKRSALTSGFKSSMLQAK